MAIPSSEQIPNIATSTSPAWSTFGSNPTGTLLAWKGQQADTKIYWSTTTSLTPDKTTNQYTWSPSQPVPNALSLTGPAVCRFQGKT